jgi:hypothetical protein
MNKLTSIAFALTAVFAMTATAQAATAEVTWQDVEDYRDIRAAQESQERFQNSVTSGLTAHFQELAATLPADHVLRITVTDLDLAGRVEPIYIDNFTPVRVINRIDYPMISLNFEYLDGSGAVLKSGAETVKDMGLLETRKAMMESGRDYLYHEKRLLDKWFNANFPR